MAWLNTAPKPIAGSEREKQLRGKSLPTRIAEMKRYRAVIPMPPNPAPHIIARFVELGINEEAGMGAAPLSWREIMAWQEAVSLRLAPWEARLLRRLSTEYLAECRRAETENCPPPWQWPFSEADRAAEQAALDAVLG